MKGFCANGAHLPYFFIYLAHEGTEGATVDNLKERLSLHVSVARKKGVCLCVGGCFIWQ